jgi:hypothetical protein
MLLLEQTRKASFKNFTFLVETVEESGGRKVAIFNYANSDKLFIDDLGGLPQDFSINCVIKGVNFIEESEQFRLLLLDKEYGRLILPTLGIVTAKAITYRRTESTGSIGQHVYSVQFKLSEMVGAVPEEEVSAQEIFGKYDESMDALADQLLAEWNPPETNTNKQSAISDAKSFCESAREVAGEINQVARNIQDIIDTVDTAINQAEFYVDIMVTEGVFAGLASLAGIGPAYQKCYDLGKWGSKLPDRLQNIGSGLVEAFSSFGSLSEDEFDIVLFQQNYTAEWESRNKTRILQVETNRLQAIGLMMYSITGLELNTVSEINTVRTQIERFWTGIFENTNSIIAVKDDITLKFIELKELVFLYLSQKETEAYYTEEIDVPLLSSRNLTYRLYRESVTSEAELEQVENILVKENDKPIFEGFTTVLQK